MNDKLHVIPFFKEKNGINSKINEILFTGKIPIFLMPPNDPLLESNFGFKNLTT